MPNFVTDTVTIAQDKVDRYDLITPENESVQAAEWNATVGALYDLRGAVLAADAAADAAQTTADSAVSAASVAQTAANAAQSTADAAQTTANAAQTTANAAAPAARTVNGHALSADVTVVASEVPFAPTGTVTELNVQAAIAGVGARAGWQTAFDVDFSALSNQTLNADTTYALGGVTWTKINSSADRVAMAVVAGSGLVIQPGSTTDLSGSARTLPALVVSLASVISGWYDGTPVRASVYVSAINLAADFDGVRMAFENGGTPTRSAFKAAKYFSATAGVGPGVNLNNGAGGSTLLSGAPWNTHNVLVLEMPAGVRSGNASMSSGLWSSGWPALSAMSTVGGMSTSSTSAVFPATTGWNLLIGASRNGSGTLLSATIARIKLEYRVA